MGRAFAKIFRVSLWLRLIWVAVAALHAWLFTRRLVAGDMHGWLDPLKMLLCLAAIGYATLKFWRIATVFDCVPRRAIGFAFLLMFGHWLLAAPQDRAAFEANAPALAAVMAVAVLPVGVALAVAGMAVSSFFTPVFARLAPRVRAAFLYDLHPWVAPLCESPPNLFRRPPPRSF